MLKAGDKIPLETKVLDKDSNEVTIKDFLTNKYLLLYFYPKDNTPGCTAEACELRDFNSEIQKLDTRIVGISNDSVKSHNDFIKKNSLNFELLTDVDHKLQDDFGVWKPKKLFGKEFLGTLRTTFLLDQSGLIIYVWEGVKPEGHAKEIYEYIRKL